MGFCPSGLLSVPRFKLCCFSIPVGVCIDVNFIAADVMISSYILYVSTNYKLATVYKGQGSHRNSKTKFHDFSMINNVISMII